MQPPCDQHETPSRLVDRALDGTGTGWMVQTVPALAASGLPAASITMAARHVKSRFM
jgi:hypothetical protein